MSGTVSNTRSSSKLIAYIRLVKSNRWYRRFWFSGLISQAGDWFNYIGLFVLLTDLTGSGRMVSWFLIAKFIPTTIFGPLAGIVADRVSRKTILVGCDLLRCLLVLGYLAVDSRQQVWLIYVLAFIQETLWSFAHPARQASIPDLCSREELGPANGLSGASWSIMLALGAAAGGWVAARFGWQVAIVIDSLSFLLSALLLSSIPLPLPRRTRHDGFSLARLTGLADLAEGIRYVWAHREVAILLVVKSGWALSGGILVMLTYFGEQVFAENGRGGLSGVLYSMRGLGAAVGPLLAWRFFGDTLAGMRRAIGLAFFISSVAYLGFSQAPTLLVASVCVFWGHVGGSIQWVFSTTLLHRQVDAGFRGRVFAAEMGLLTLVLSISTWCTGMALDQGIAPRIVVIALALLFLLPGCAWIALQKAFQQGD